MIYCVIKAGQIETPGRAIESRSYKHYSKPDFINDLKTVDCSLVNDEEDIDQAVFKWKELITSIIDKHAPVKMSKIRGTPTSWMTAVLSKLLQRRDLLHRKAIKSKSKNHWSKFKNLRNTVNQEIRKCKVDDYSKLIKDNKNNSSALWKTLNEITSRKVNSPVSCTEAYTATRNLLPIF